VLLEAVLALAARLAADAVDPMDWLEGVGSALFTVGAMEPPPPQPESKAIIKVNALKSLVIIV
jgi:hypothetical protein